MRFLLEPAGVPPWEHCLPADLFAAADVVLLATRGVTRFADSFSTTAEGPTLAGPGVSYGKDSNVGTTLNEPSALCEDEVAGPCLITKGILRSY